jgi:hypothetical protein
VQLDQRTVVKVLIQSIGMGKEKVCAENEIKLIIFERQYRALAAGNPVDGP